MNRATRWDLELERLEAELDRASHQRSVGSCLIIGGKIVAQIGGGCVVFDRFVPLEQIERVRAWLAEWFEEEERPADAGV